MHHEGNYMKRLFFWGGEERLVRGLSTDCVSVSVSVSHYLESTWVCDLTRREGEKDKSTTDTNAKHAHSQFPAFSQDSHLTSASQHGC